MDRRPGTMERLRTTEVPRGVVEWLWIGLAAIVIGVLVAIGIWASPKLGWGDDADLVALLDCHPITQSDSALVVGNDHVPEARPEVLAHRWLGPGWSAGAIGLHEASADRTVFVSRDADRRVTGVLELGLDEGDAWRVTGGASCLERFEETIP